ncbi:YrdB family protein [Ammoniphilus sp. CFH 90114]|uniref:YrdB family protein n=1 Tax=Ammoniphilus sp. CFH 90114 TaxID=2493665 RepID=UPI00100F6874|nr:YrdB family protein [Ammoniphilus sp. CFH 90114]RXT01912.1 DUF2568 domain-containing protein [Ammoniphilus sp. CFH 90114]
MLILQMINLGVRFTLELVALWIFGYWAYQMGSTGVTKLLLGASAPLGIAILWGIFGSPKAIYPLTGGLHYLLEFIVFGLPGLLLWFLEKPNWAIVYGVVVAVNKVLMVVWDQ